MREPVVAANWKMHKTVGEAVAFVDAFLPAIQEIPSCTVVLCPPFTALWAVGQRLRGTQVALGAQNLFWREQGAFTGEISPIMLRDVGCSFVIIGHSERRGRFGKPDPELEKVAIGSRRRTYIQVIAGGNFQTRTPFKAKDETARQPKRATKFVGDYNRKQVAP